ncbi:GIY-YIG nuclease family protein [Nonomuraea typhae]|uniref:GIY-YIG nuclease family protein n=1 Tax=Nonomuraea typhae TaxID=2603600 RepID=UPI0012F8F2EE|nr:GIY-YIG nuclease family protein [Nonomuraea typhae]
MTDLEGSADHALYRFFNADGGLLYIGISVNPPQRFRRHKGDQPWWCEVTQITIERFGSRPDVLAAEKQAIESEHPLYNLIHNSGEPLTKSAKQGRWDYLGRLVISLDPAWQAVSAAHPELIMLEQWVKYIGETYRQWTSYAPEYGEADHEYVCANELWQGTGNARRLLGDRLSIPAFIGAVAGADAGKPIWAGGLSQCPSEIRVLSHGFIRTWVDQGWDAPDELKTDVVHETVARRMLALMPQCRDCCCPKAE